jgi:hypothetical protein
MDRDVRHSDRRVTRRFRKWTAEQRGCREHRECARRDAHTRVQIRVDPSMVAEDRLRLRLGGDFMQRVLVEAITPTPERWTVENGTIVAELPVGRSGGPVPIAMDFSPREFGRTTLELSAGPGRALAIRQFVYP